MSQIYDIIDAAIILVRQTEILAQIVHSKWSEIEEKRYKQNVREGARHLLSWCVFATTITRVLTIASRQT